MKSLVLAHRRSDSHTAAFDAHTQSLPGGLETLVGPVSPDAAGSLDRELGTVGPAIFPIGLDILVDCGRLLSGAPGQHGIVKAADHVIVVSRADGAGLAHALWTLDAVRGLGIVGASSFVVVGPSQFRAKEIERVREGFMGTIPLDDKSAAMACGSPGNSKRFAQSNLVASARDLVNQLFGLPAIRHKRQNLPGDDGPFPSLNVDVPGSELALSGERGVETK
jgi:hypothetical protein